MLWRSISTLARNGLKDIFSFQVSPPGQHNTVSRAAYCPRTTVWADLV